MKDVSALMDGELERRRVRSTITRLEGQDELRDAWATFHVIRDALQGNAVGSSRFIEKFHERLEQEPVPVVPRWRANLRRLRTMALAGASALVVIAIGWVATSGLRSPSSVGQPAAAVLVDGGFNDSVAIEFAMAHRQLVPAFVAGPASAVQVPETAAQPAEGGSR